MKFKRNHKYNIELTNFGNFKKNKLIINAEDPDDLFEFKEELIPEGVNFDFDIHEFFGTDSYFRLFVYFNEHGGQNIATMDVRPEEGYAEIEFEPVIKNKSYELLKVLDDKEFDQLVEKYLPKIEAYLEE